MSSSFVAVLMGSDSDLPVMQACLDLLNKLNIPFEVRITSAHRTPDKTRAYVLDADARGCAVFIAAAGMAAHLAGAVAAHTLRPVIGIPIDSGPMQGLDALLSTVQMPGGIPVATVAIGKSEKRLEQCCLTCPVGTDEAHDPAPLDFETDVVDSANIAEVFRHSVSFNEASHRRSPNLRMVCQLPATPTRQDQACRSFPALSAILCRRSVSARP